MPRTITADSLPAALPPSRVSQPLRLRRLIVAALGVVVIAGSPAAAHDAVGTSEATVVIANRSSLPDVAVAIALAASDPDVTLALTESESDLGAEAERALARLRPLRVVLIGGRTVLSDDLYAKVTAFAVDADVQRKAGSSRIGTAALAARLQPLTNPPEFEGKPTATQRSLAVVHGWTAQDVALGAACVASGCADDLLFTSYARLSEGVANFVADHPPSRIILLGRVASAVSPAAADLDSSAGAAPVERWENGEPGEIAVAANGGSVPAAWRFGVLVDADDPSAVLAGAAAAADPDSVVLFARRGTVTDASYRLRDLWLPERLTALGEAVSVLPGWAPVGSSAATGESTTQRTYVSVSAGNANYTCGLRSSGAIECWGVNNDGAARPPGGVFSAVSAGSRHACAIRSDGRLACWGRSTYGRSSPPSGKFSAVSAGWQHSCAIRTNGRLACWGRSSSGESSPPGGTFAALDAGGGHTCALRTDRRVRCWGENGGGEASAPSGQYTAVATGSSHSCAIRTDGRLACWGQNIRGQSKPPQGKYTALALGQNFGCAVRDDGTIVCWGDNRDGEASPPAGAFTDITAGRQFACGRRPEGTVTCWGFRTQPQVAVAVLP